MTLLKQLCPTPPKLIMFDLDGTLIDSVPDLAHAVDSMLTDLAKNKAGVEQVRNWVGNGAAMLVKRALSGKMEPDQIDESEFKRAHQLFLHHYQQVSGLKSKPYPNVRETLRHLRQETPYLAVITNKPQQFTPHLLKSHDLPEFDLIICGDTLAEKKPHPAPLLHCMEALGCLKEESIMVGDSLSDIKAAQAAGVPMICVEYGYHQGIDLASHQPDYLIPDFGDLLKPHR